MVLHRTFIAAAAAVAGSCVLAQEVELVAKPFRAAAPALSLPVAPYRVPGQVAEPVRGTAVKTWDVDVKDVNIAGTFVKWGRAAGWQVRWDANKHILVDAPDRLAGSFEDAVRAVLEAPGIAQSSYPLEVCFYPNTPPLARITRKGDQSKECN